MELVMPTCLYETATS